MFDTVHVELEDDSFTYQTKDLDCNFDTYKVTSEGIFILKNNSYYSVPWVCGKVTLHSWDIKTNEVARRVFHFEEGKLK